MRRESMLRIVCDAATIAIMSFHDQHTVRLSPRSRSASARISRYSRWIDSILLRPLPFPQVGKRLGDNLQHLPESWGVRRTTVRSITNYYEPSRNIPAFSSLSIFVTSAKSSAKPVRPEQNRNHARLARFFPTLGVNLAMVVPSPKTKLKSRKAKAPESIVTDATAATS